MKKSELKIQAERLSSAYDKNSMAWANLHVLYAALKSGEDVPTWAILDSIKSISKTTGEVGLDLAEFLDSYHSGG